VWPPSAVGGFHKGWYSCPGRPSNTPSGWGHLRHREDCEGGPHDFGAHIISTLHHRVKVIHLEPEKHTIAVRFVDAIPDRAVMMFDFETVQLRRTI
jgi:hypothetical protein